VAAALTLAASRVHAQSNSGSAPAGCGPGDLDAGPRQLLVVGRRPGALPRRHVGRCRAREVDRGRYTAGDVRADVSIQSISKVFTMAQVIQECGTEAIERRIGVDATGMRFALNGHPYSARPGR